MRGKRPPVSPEEQALFLAAIGGTQPLDHGARDRVPVPPPPPSPVRVSELPPTVALAVDGDSQRYAARAPGVSIAQVQQLRAGKLHVEHTLDLHGESVEGARTRLRQLVLGANHRRCLLIIHGKGTHSDHGAPLREAVLGELLGPLSGVVYAFATAQPSDGGEGATYLLVRGRK